MNSLHVKSIKLVHILSDLCGFRRFLPLKACFSITVILVITSSFDRNNSDGKASLKQQNYNGHKRCE